MKRISYFQIVRDVPYRIPIGPKEKDNTCYGKHVLLKSCLEGIGMTVRPRICEFSWSDMPLPAEVMNIFHEDACHAYLEVMVRGKWLTLDATWDKGLESILPVNDWDGKYGTCIAVPSKKIYSPKESFEIFNEEEDIEEDLRINGKFYEAFNAWLDDARAKSKILCF